MRRSFRLACVLLPWLATAPAMAQEAVLDTAKPFTADAAEIEQYLRGPVGWPTFQQGKAGELFFRFDPDGYARFGTTERLDEDYWEISCKPSPTDCTAQRGPVRLGVDKGGQITIKLEGAQPADGFSLDGTDGEPAPLSALLSAPRVASLLKASSLTPASGGEPLPINGLETVATYIRWVENDQVGELAFDAKPHRPFAVLPPPKPAGQPPSATPKKLPPGAQPASGASAARPAVTPAAEDQAAPAPQNGPGVVPTVPPSGAMRGPTAAAATEPPPPAEATSQNTQPAPAVVPPAREQAASSPANTKAPMQLVPPAARTPAATAAPAAQPARLAAAPKQTKAANASSPTPESRAACEPGRIAPAELRKPIDSLRELPGVLVVTDYLIEPPTLKDKLRNQVQAVIENRFQAAGIRLLTKEEVEKTPGRPQLELYLTPGDATKGCVFRVWISLRQEVVLARDTSIHLLTGTWGDGGVARPGDAEEGPELATFIYYLDRFVRDYRIANGLEPQVEAAPAVPARSQTRAPRADGGQDLVLAVQALLEESGYDPGPADGQLGPRTQSAIEAFQRDHAMPVNGKPSRAVLDRLLGRRPDGPS